MSMTKIPRVLTLGVALAAFGACGDSDEDDNGTDTSTDMGGGDTDSPDGDSPDAGGDDVESPDTGAEETGGDDATPTPNIVELAVATDFLSTLVAAVQAADLAGTLSGTGPFTVFAPTNDAFAALPEGVLDGLLADTEALTQVLLYHVVPGSFPASDVVAASSLETAQGGELAVVVDGDTVTVGGATVTATDIMASNGIVHVIDTVLVPPTEPEFGNIAEVATAAGNFTTLLAALTAADLADDVATTEDITVFAPTDAAFALLPEGTVEALLADIPALTDILTYHVVPGVFEAEDVVAASLLPTLNGTRLKVEVTDDGATVGGAMISVTDIQASNGVIHVIDAVILPPGTIVDIAVDNADFSTLVTAVTAAELAETLSGEGPFTVFAPVNAAFDALPEGVLTGLLADIPALTDVLTYHVAAGYFAAEDVLELTSLAMVNGDTAAIALVDGAPTIGGASIVATDIPASNGVIHVLGDVMLPPAE